LLQYRNSEANEVMSTSKTSWTQKTFFDIRITYPTSQSYYGKSLAEIYQQPEKERKDKYNQRVIDIEKSSFNPLVFTTTGGMAPECNRVNKRLAEKIA